MAGFRARRKMRRVRPQVQLTQETLFDFLSSTKLPWLSRLSTIVRWLSLALVVATVGYGALALAWWPDGFWSARLPGTGALPALVAAPACLLAWWFARQGRMQFAIVSLFAASYAVSVLATWPRGAFSTTWYLQPILALLGTCCLGTLPGLLLTMVGVASLVLVPLSSADSGQDSVAWQHSASLAALTLSSALAGLVLHHLLRKALMVAETIRVQQQETQRALRHRERLLRHAMRVETVGDLAGMVTHQLRNAFQVMLGHATLGAMGDDADRQKRLALLGEELANARPLLDQLMALAHPDEGAPAAIDLEEEAREFHARAVRVMPANITLGLETCGHALPVLLNPRGLEHALWNLVINARQAMPDGGSITLRTSSQDGVARIAVVDTGHGIPPEIRDRVFDAYFTTKPVGQGTGLGLAAVDRFVRSSNGAVALDSEVGVGTTFALSFPLAPVPVQLSR